MNVILVGMPGCGKTAVGKRLAKQMALDFFDADEELERYYHRKIPDIFEQDGEAGFRRMETATLLRLFQHDGCVIATGGGAVTREENMQAAGKHGVIVFINRPVEHILSDIVTAHRPLLAGGAEKLHRLYEERFALYRSYADLEIENTADLNTAVQTIMQGVNEYENSCHQRAEH